MATTAYGVNHPLAVKLWSKKLHREALKETFVQRFMGSTPDSLVQVKDETSKSAGDRITFGLRMQLSGDGVSGDGTLEGQEEALTTYSENLFIDQLRHAVRSDGRMSEQRVPFSVREEAMAGLRDWWADRIDTSFFNQISGNTGQTDTKYTGLQAATAPTSAAGNTRILYAGDEASEASVSTSTTAANHFMLTLFDRAVNQAKTATPLIRPIRTSSGPKYVCFLHPNQIYQLRTDATANRITWYDTQKARVGGGEMDNGIFSGAHGEYNGTIIHESTRIPLAPSTTAVRRAVFCGAQAGVYATGSDNSSNQMSWVEELFDYGNQLGVSAGMIWGIKKPVFNSIDFGTIVISTYSPAP